MALCPYCTGMTLQRLVDLAKRDFRSGFFPNVDYYHHHASFVELEECATTAEEVEGGCSLCRLILESFEGAQHDPNDPTWPVPDKAASTGTPGPTMRDVALKLTHSDVRIALRSRHVATGATLKYVRMFDLLAIRLGDRLELGDPLRVPDLLLVLRIPKSENDGFDYSSLQKSLPLIDGFQIGCAEVDGNLGSIGNFRLTRSWLDDCKNSHNNCSTTTNPPRLPTRVIDVSVIPPRIVHAIDINTGRLDHGCAEYVALSHCWGGPIKTLLKTTTASAFALSLPPASELPTNFRDAMEITRALDICYLWIDSLCILQDSVDDWRHESRMMGDVYSLATVSLLAMTARASDVGILGKTPGGQQSDSIVVPFAYDDASPPTSFKVSAIFQNDESLRQLSEEAPLSERGWALQELVFSSRILFYGKHQIYWYCLEGGYKSTGALPDGYMYPHNKYPSMASRYYADKNNCDNSSASTDVEAILSDFYHFIQSYTQRSLTFGTDKFPAVSSFAQSVHRALTNACGRAAGLSSQRYDYMAGVWSGDFRRGLLFCPERMHCLHVLQKSEKGGMYRAPSWSWAVTDCPITFVAAQTPLSSTPSPLNAKLLSWSTVPRDPNNAFGAVDDAHLVVRGRVCRLRRSAHHFIGAYTWHKEEEEGTAWFDDRPTVTDRSGKTEPLDTTNGICIVFEGDDEGDDDIFLCTYYAPGTSTGSKATVSPDVNDYEGQEYTIFMVDLGQEDYHNKNEEEESDEDDWEMTERLIHCLILRQVPDAATSVMTEAVDGVYERVGCLILEWKNRRRVDNWRVQKLKLV